MLYIRQSKNNTVLLVFSPDFFPIKNLKFIKELLESASSKVFLFSKPISNIEKSCQILYKDWSEINGTKSAGKKLLMKSNLILLKLSGKHSQ